MNLENSLYKVEQKSFDKEIELPSSKSHSNRALIIGALRGNGFRVDNLSTSSDVTTLLNCLKSVGINITNINNSVTFLNSFPSCEKDIENEVIDLKTGDGGTTNRFLLALLSRGNKTYRFFPSEKMSERPMEDLISPLKKLGVQIDTASKAWITVKGPAKINIDKLEIDCKQSTQFASAIMLAFSNSKLQLDLKNIEASETYIEMTKFILNETKTKNSYFVPVDFSSLSYPVALALVCGKVLIKNCHGLDPMQADSKFIELVQKAGGDIHWTKSGLLATSKNTLKPFQANGADFPDLIPTLAFMAAHIEGESVLTNLAVLHHKESDRVEELMNLLKKMDVNFKYIKEKEEIRIHGDKEKYSAATLTPARDHRMVMTSYLFLRANNGGRLSEADCVNKSFPNFFEIMK